MIIIPQIITVNLVTLVTRVIQETKDLLDTKGSKELKVICDYLCALANCTSRDCALLCAYQALIESKIILWECTVTELKKICDILQYNLMSVCGWVRM